MKKKFICRILIILMLQYFCTFVFAENSLTNEIVNDVTNELSLEEQKEQVESQIEETNTKLEYVQEELSDTLLKVQETEDKIMQYEKDIEELATKMENLQKSIDEANIALTESEQTYQEKSNLLAKRLVAMYEAGETQYLDILLNSRDITDFISRYYVIQEIAEYDSILIHQIEEEKNNLEITKQKLEKEQGELKIIKSKSEQTSIVLSNMKTLQQSYVDDLTEGEKILQEQLTEYKKEQEEIERQIELATNAIDPDIQYTGGEMLWPVAISGTAITSNYGVREHPIQGVVREHTGIDIGNTPLGSPVVAAADGVVTYAGWLGGYGNCVMINHGDGIVTLYGHGNKILTTVNTEVKQGDVIMEVGSTGNSTGPHLHFEVRVNGEYTNPLNFVKVP